MKTLKLVSISSVRLVNKDNMQIEPFDLLIFERDRRFSIIKARKQTCSLELISKSLADSFLCDTGFVINIPTGYVISSSNGLPPAPAPAYPVYSYLGKRQVTAIKVTPAPTTPPKPKPSGGVTKPTVKPTPPPVPTTK